MLFILNMVGAVAGVVYYVPSGYHWVKKQFSPKPRPLHEVLKREPPKVSNGDDAQ